MKYIINLVTNNIVSNIKKNSDESLFLINGFEDLRIYVHICEQLTLAANNMNKTINIKLAKNKWEYFKEKNAGSPLLHTMYQNNWISDAESTTHYRNLHEEDILVLMGTETEDDISGSLKDIYEIRCDRLTDFLPKSKGRVCYSDIFDYLGTNFSDQEKDVVNKLYRDLFELVTPNICKLSSFLDDNISQITTITDFIEIFYNTLPTWGIPKRQNGLPKVNQIKGRNLLRGQYNFINGVPFKSFTPSLFNKYKKKIELYNEELKEYSSAWDGWNTQSITSYDEFSNVILSFIKGDRSVKTRNLLLNLDYAIVEDVLGLKLPTEASPKKAVEKIYGNPLKVFATVYLNTLATLRNKNISTDKILFSFIDASILTESSEDNNELINAWKNLCVHTLGAIEEIADYGYTLNGESVSLEYEPKNYFGITANLDNTIHAAGSNKKVSQINFKVMYAENDKLKKESEYLWIFEPNEDWLNNYNDLSSADFAKTPNNAFIPLTTMKNLESLIVKKSEEEFFDYLIEKGNLDFSYNILNEGCNIDLFKENDKYHLFYDLGNKFSSYCNEISLNGVYNAISNRNGKANSLIDSYRKLGNTIINKKFNENEYYILDLFIHAFNIEQSNKSIANDKDIECCIVPPWHPASVEKIKHAVLFFLDGCFKFWNEIEMQDESNKITFNMIKDKIDELNQLSIFQNSVDVFPTSGATYFGSTTTYGNYSLYAKKDLKVDNNLRDLVKKEFVFDDDFKNNTYSTMTEDSRMIYGVIENYIKAFPDSKDKLNLVFIDPSDLQPIISSVHHYIQEYQKMYGEDKELSISLRILVKPENKGGKNYITYWMNESFDLDSNIKVKTYMNEWKNKSELDKLLNSNNDIIFVMDLLKVNDFEFINKIDHYEPGIDECYFPIVFRPSPISNTSTKRRIELTQPQFGAARMHTQVVHYRKNLENINNDLYYAVKTVNIDEEIQNLVCELHNKAYWVVCIDASMDGKLLKDNNSNSNYSVIGFSTGKGKYGQYNITITARTSILKSIENNFSKRLSMMFHWGSELVNKASKICMQEASNLDGISVLTASNQRDYNINEFMAYVLTSLRDREKDNTSPLRIIVHLDSYKHWFDTNGEIKNIFDTDFSKSRPDFLILSVDKDFTEKIKIKATVVECKMASINNKPQHANKAIEQVKHGIEVLSNIFNPNSNSLKRRYWYAQLYRALAFAQISFNNASTEFTELSNKLRGILNGNFEIEWDGQILGYWLDMDGETESTEIISDVINLYNIPQKRIQRLILGKDENVNYVNFDLSLLSDEEHYSKLADEQENQIDEMFEKHERIRLTNIASVSINEQNEETIESNRNVIETNEILNENEPEVEQELTNNVNSLTNNSLEHKVEEPSNNEKIESNSNKDIRVLIGTDKFGSDIYWEFGHKQLANRHLLITGTSGQGKTYCIQTLLYELSKNNISSVIFDYTEGFTRNQLEPEFLDGVGDKINEHVVYALGVPINPFKRHEIEVAGTVFKEKEVDVATRLANIFKHVYDFGDQQFSAIFNAARIGLKKHGDRMNIEYFHEELENLKATNPAAKTVISKMEPFFYTVDFVDDSDFDWSKILYTDDAKINIFQLTRIDRQMQVIITELMLWDAWYYTQKVGTKDKPFAVVLDEAQNLSHKQSSPSAKILTEGRKFGWSAWFATQSLKVLADDEVVRLMQASFKFYFKPTDDELLKIAKQIDPTDSSAWLNPIKNLTKGQCIIIGDRIRNDGTFGSCKPTVTSVSSFGKRK